MIGERERNERDSEDVNSCVHNACFILAHTSYGVILWLKCRYFYEDLLSKLQSLGAKSTSNTSLNPVLLTKHTVSVSLNLSSYTLQIRFAISKLSPLVKHARNGMDLNARTLIIDPMVLCALCFDL
eukprot:209549_1